MDDYISRKAAIDLLLKFSHGAYIEAPVDEAVDAFKELPALMQMPSGAVITDEMFDFCSSVEKMQEKINEIINSAGPEIIMCKDCKHRDPEDKKCDCGHDILWQLPRQNEWFCADGERR